MFRFDTIILGEDVPCLRTHAQSIYLFETKEHPKLCLIGAGAYALAYSHPSVDYVVRLSTGGDLGYYSYLTAMADKKWNRYLPKIHSAVHFRRPDRLYSGWQKPGFTHDDILITVTEKLEHVPIGPFHPVYHHRLLAYLSEIESYLKENRRTSNQDRNFAFDILKESSYWNGTQHDFDLHGRNIMKRGPQLVFTDPFSF
jgi:hypothetical protein